MDDDIYSQFEEELREYVLVLVKLTKTLCTLLPEEEQGEVVSKIKELGVAYKAFDFAMRQGTRLVNPQIVDNKTSEERIKFAQHVFEIAKLFKVRSNQTFDVQ